MIASRRPSVAVVTTYYRPVLGGAESAAERLATFLQRRGHAVTVLTTRTSVAHAERETIDGVTVERLRPIGERSARGKWVILPSIFRALMARRKTIDVICCIDYRGIGLAALAAGRISGKPVVFQAQTEGVLSGARLREWAGRLGGARDGALANAITWPLRSLYRRADAIGCISHDLEREAAAAGVPRERVYYLPNPIDARLFSPATPEERGALRQEFSLRSDAVVAIFVGRLSREKGVMELVRAWAIARPDAQLVFVGPAMTNHPWDVSREAQAFVESQGLSDNVRFIGGQPTGVVAKWLKAGDFSVQPSAFEAMGLAAAEAMGAGLPVIASDATGYRDFVIDGRTGLIVPAGDVPALAAALTRLVGNPTLRAELGARARDVAAEFDERVVLERFAELIDLLATRSAAAASSGKRLAP